ncbi:MAG: hypothetical protein GC159_02185 [Phycisphaera sp.]|nr:hypothetical protein [Phycisphaera sp.]
MNSNMTVRAWGMLFAAAMLLATGVSRAEDVEEKLPSPADGPSFVVSSINLRYGGDVAGLPDLEPMMDLAMRLHRTGDGWVAPRTPGIRDNEFIQLSRIPGMSEHRYYASAIRAISLGLVKKFGRMGYAGISVQVDSAQITPDGADQRGADDKSLTLVINAVTVAEVHTIGAGDRFPEEERRDNAMHAGIAAGTPIAPNDGRIIDRDALENYLEWLNRHPGRRVDAAVARGTEPGTVNLEYVVQESKPWFAFFQASNTGTKQTSNWRERFGFVHNQLTGHDDTLNLSYMTGGFHDVHAFSGSYEAPFFPYASIDGLERLRWRVSGSYSEFVASDLGFSDAFSGNNWSVGGEVIWNFFQQKSYFVDAYMGLTYQDIYNKNSLTDEAGDEQFLRIDGGLRMQNIQDTYSTFGSIGLDANLPGAAGTDEKEAALLGRENVDDSWVLLQGDLSHSMYLDPIFYGKKWDDASTPETSTMAHELYVSVRGQVALDDSRLIPQMQQTIGGLYSVRGYRESAAVGDNAVYGTIEYRYHVPRAFAVEPEPRQIYGEPFRVARQSTYGRPDWDLVLKTFIDAGHVSQNDRLDSESDRSLVGTGIGMDLSIRNNFTVRVDWAFALTELEDQISKGSSRVHIVCTLLY